MKIVFIGTFGLYPKGTIRDRAVPMAQSLIDRGHDVVVLAPPWDNPIDSGKEMQIGGVKVVNIKLPPHIPMWSHASITLRLLSRAAKEKPDIIHLFKPKAYSAFTAMALWLARRLKITRVPFVVDTDDWEGDGGWNDLQSYTWTQKRLFAFQEKWTLRHADSVTAASKALADMAASLGVPASRVFYVPNGLSPEQMSRNINSSQWVRETHGLDVSSVILLYTRFFEFKLEYLLDVIGRIFAQVPDAKLLVVGKGLFGEEKQLQELARRLGIAGRVFQVGWVDREKLGDYFGAADAAIYPLEDTLVNRTKCPVKLVDLLSAGVPVVAGRVGESSQYIQDGQTGLLVDSGDSEEMAAAVVRLLGDEQLRRKLGEEARLHLTSNYRWVQLALKVEEAYGAAMLSF